MMPLRLMAALVAGYGAAIGTFACGWQRTGMAIAAVLGLGFLAALHLALTRKVKS